MWISLCGAQSDGQYSAPVKSVSYAVAEIVSVSGCVGDTLLSTIRCNRTGGNILTISGSNFGAGGALVLIGSDLCQDIRFCLKWPEAHSYPSRAFYPLCFILLLVIPLSPRIQRGRVEHRRYYTPTCDTA